MNDPDRVKLLFGPYKPPPLRRGDRVLCDYRDCEVVITGWTDAPISWPRCRPVPPLVGGTGLLFDAELVRAILHESAAAVEYWWRVNQSSVCRWRKASLGSTRKNNEGSHRLVLGDLGDAGRAIRQAGESRGHARHVTLSCARSAGGMDA